MLQQHPYKTALLSVNEVLFNFIFCQFNICPIWSASKLVKWFVARNIKPIVSMDVRAGLIYIYFPFYVHMKAPLPSSAVMTTL
jgi:hypothetical protein